MILYCTDSPIFIKDGRIYTLGLASIIKRYYDAFGKFNILAKKKDWNPKLPLIDVTPYLKEVITFSNMKELIFPSKSLIKGLREMLIESEVVVLRVPSLNSRIIMKELKLHPRPVLAEVMGCPWDMYWNHSIKGKIISPYMVYKTKKIVRSSDFVHYVTEEFLQNRYPTNSDVVVGVSDVKIPQVDKKVLDNRIKRINNMNTKNIIVMTSAAIDVVYKGQQYMIEAINLLKKSGIEVTYVLAGGGDNNRLLKLAKKYGVENNVVFKGRLSMEEIIASLDKCDIYVQPSLQEGLPRALVEAMSRACPAIGAKTGGIPELLPDECVVTRKSPEALANTIMYMLSKGLEKYAKLSYFRALDFDDLLLKSKMDSFYSEIKDKLHITVY